MTTIKIITATLNSAFNSPNGEQELGPNAIFDNLSEDEKQGGSEIIGSKIGKDDEILIFLMFYNDLIYLSKVFSWDIGSSFDSIEKFQYKFKISDIGKSNTIVGFLEHIRTEDKTNFEKIFNYFSTINNLQSNLEANKNGTTFVQKFQNKWNKIMSEYFTVNKTIQINGISIIEGKSITIHDKVIDQTSRPTIKQDIQNNQKKGFFIGLRMIYAILKSGQITSENCIIFNVESKEFDSNYNNFSELFPFAISEKSVKKEKPLKSYITFTNDALEYFSSGSIYIGDKRKKEFKDVKHWKLISTL